MATYPRRLWGSGDGSMLWKTAIVLFCLLAAIPLCAREKDTTQYGTGLIVNVPFPESDVTQVVQDVIQNGLIRGTKEYNKDEYVSGASSASSTKVFKEWTEGGKVFYKVRLKALDPRNFKDGGDVGTLAVRYVVEAQNEKNTILRIDAVFVEDFRHISHASNGSVEGAEYKDIHDRLEAIQLMKTQTAEAEREKQEAGSKTQPSSGLTDVPQSSSQPAALAPAAIANDGSTKRSTPNPSTTEEKPQTLEQRVQDLRRQVERLVKSPGAPLKSAPFHTASTLQSLPPGTEVLIVVSTTYWLGVETHDGQHGWIMRDELELVP
jgi:hypothetical protein